MDIDFICTTIIEFADRAEGQVLHRGTKEDCEKTAQLISAVSYNGPDLPIASRVCVLRADELELQSGERWQLARPSNGAAL